MLKAFMLDGSLVGDETLAMPREILAAELGFRDWQVEAALLRDLSIADCAACYSCWIATPGICRVDDPGRDVARLAAQCDLLVFLTPITFGGYSSELKKAVDRLLPNVSPYFESVGGETHHRRRYPRSPALLAVGLAPDRDDARADIFRRLVERNAINLRSPAHATAVVGLGWGGDELRREILMALAAVGVEV